MARRVLGNDPFLRGAANRVDENGAPEPVKAPTPPPPPQPKKKARGAAPKVEKKEKPLPPPPPKAATKPKKKVIGPQLARRGPHVSPRPHRHAPGATSLLQGPVPHGGAPDARPLPSGPIAHAGAPVAQPLPSGPVAHAGAPVAQPLPSGPIAHAGAPVAQPLPSGPIAHAGAPVAQPLPSGPVAHSGTPIAQPLPSGPIAHAGAPVAQPLPSGPIAHAGAPVAQPLPSGPVAHAGTPIAQPLPSGPIAHAGAPSAQPLPSGPIAHAGVPSADTLPRGAVAHADAPSAEDPRPPPPFASPPSPPMRVGDAPGLGATVGGVLKAVGTALGLSSDAAKVDLWGRDEALANSLRPMADLLFERYWRVQADGVHHVPRGPSIIVANHAGALPLDGPMLHLLLRRERPDLKEARWLLEDQVFYAPVIGLLANRLGAVRASPENALKLLGEGRPLIVFPEGFYGLSKPFTERYQLRRFGRGGYLKIAQRAGVPVVPCAIVGGEESMPLLGKLPSGPLGLPYLPVTLPPLPVRWHIRFSEPVTLDDAPEDLESDPSYLHRTNELVRDTVQHLLNSLLSEREGVF